MKHQIHDELLKRLNGLDYYSLPFPKSLANDFGTDTIFPLIDSYGLAATDSLRTYTEHIVQQLKTSILSSSYSIQSTSSSNKLLVTGGGAFNRFLIERLSQELAEAGIVVVVPDENLVKYKEALVMALIGVLRWRQEYTTLCSVTGAERDSIGGALWNGQEA